MPDELATILRLVAEGKLSADEAAPIIAALEARDRRSRGEERPGAAGAPARPDKPAGAGRRMRILVTEAGRSVADVRVPLVLAGLATDRVPGLSDASRNRIREALDRGLTGPILEVKDEDDEVRIFVE